MGRLTKTKVDEIVKLRKQDYTQKETAEKLGIHVRTVRKYDPLREQKPGSPTTEYVRECEENCMELIDKGEHVDDADFMQEWFGLEPDYFMELL